jgi:hypothetical protein
MPALSAHHRSSSTKLLLIGDSGAGKTGALASLAAAGYNLRILDFDNGLSSLVEFCTHPNSQYVKADPKVAERVTYATCTDPMKTVNGRIYARKAEAWPKALKLLSEWKTDTEDLGKLETWGPKDVLVIDSLTKMGDVAMNHHLQMNAALGAVRTQNEWRRDIGAVQTMLKDVLQLLFDAGLACNVVILSHIRMVDEKVAAGGTGQEGGSSNMVGYPSAVGASLSPQIPRWFDSVLVAKAEGSGSSVRRKIYTQPQLIGGYVVNAKNAAPLTVKKDYPLETGLADYFKDVRGA